VNQQQAQIGLNDEEIIAALARADPAQTEQLSEPPPLWLGEPPRTPARRSFRRWRPLMSGLAAGAAAASLAIIVVLSGGARPGADAVRALEAAASVAEAHAAPARRAADGRYAYFRLTVADVVTVAGREPWSVLRPTQVEQWVAPDASGRVVERSLPPEFPGRRDRRRWREQGGSAFRYSASDQRYRPGELAARADDNLPATRELPTHPDQLEVVLRRSARKSADVPENVKVLELAGLVLAQAGSSPELRAALYRVVSRIEGVELIGSMRDPRGRVGTAVAIESDYSGARTRHTLIFDPRTSQPLAQTTELLEPQDWIDGTRLHYLVTEESGRSDSLQREAAPTQPRAATAATTPGSSATRRG